MDRFELKRIQRKGEPLRGTRLWTDQRLRNAVPRCKSWAEVAQYLGVARNPSMKKRAIQLGLDFSHFQTRYHAASPVPDKALRSAMTRLYRYSDIARHLGIPTPNGGVPVGLRRRIDELRLQGHVPGYMDDNTLREACKAHATYTAVAKHYGIPVRNGNVPLWFRRRIQLVTPATPSSHRTASPSQDGRNCPPSPSSGDLG